MCVAPSFPATFRSPTNHRVRCRRWPPRGSGGVRGTGSGEGRIGGSHPLWSLSLEVNGKRRPPAGSPNTTSRHHPLESGTGMLALVLELYQWTYIHQTNFQALWDSTFLCYGLPTHGCVTSLPFLQKLLSVSIAFLIFPVTRWFMIFFCTKNLISITRLQQRHVTITDILFFLNY
ncbi:hypothetical protein U9M48_002744 [Paspalum notatum var. saurae]|uniref:Uncharacterized protein n=1 Tax=Paspalum notatum var. saurae TaxID=547442 RepID=A0AAQ3SHP1_PASNO